VKRKVIVTVMFVPECEGGITGNRGGYRLESKQRVAHNAVQMLLEGFPFDGSGKSMPRQMA
jgi:hypothetical protein